MTFSGFMVGWLLCGIAGVSLNQAIDRNLDGRELRLVDVWLVLLGALPLFGGLLRCIARCVRPKESD